MIHHKPYAESCEQNQGPILEVLQSVIDDASTVLEIASGTGQHAVYFAGQLPQLNWQTSDLLSYHDGIQAWIDDSGCNNVLPPLELDVSVPQHWPRQCYDWLFSANSLHIMSSDQVASMIQHAATVMHAQSKMIIYGPFNYEGRYTSDSNAQFDQWLKSRDPQSGIKDFQWLQQQAERVGLECRQDIAMPANNRILLWMPKSCSELNWPRRD